MKRSLLNLGAAAIIASAGFLLAAPASASIPPDNKCTAGNGASCTGAHCCADATHCWSDCS